MLTDLKKEACESKRHVHYSREFVVGGNSSNDEMSMHYVEKDDTSMWVIYFYMPGIQLHVTEGNHHACGRGLVWSCLMGGGDLGVQTELRAVQKA